MQLVSLPPGVCWCCWDWWWIDLPTCSIVYWLAVGAPPPINVGGAVPPGVSDVAGVGGRVVSSSNWCSGAVPSGPSVASLPPLSAGLGCEGPCNEAGNGVGAGWSQEICLLTGWWGWDGWRRVTGRASHLFFPLWRWGLCLLGLLVQLRVAVKQCGCRRLACQPAAGAGISANISKWVSCLRLLLRNAFWQFWMKYTNI